MARRSWLLVVMAACGTTSPSAPEPLVFAPYSVPQATSRDVFLAASGQVVVMANRVSRDGGATWAALDPRLGQLSRVAITGGTVMTYASGLVRWDVAAGAITPVAGAPSFTAERTWRVQPATGRAIVFDPIHDAIAVEGASGWSTAMLPQPTMTEVDPFINDLESNGTTALTVSAWGVHRSRDGGATWELVTTDLPGAGRDLLVLADGRFLLFGGATSYLFDASGAAAGTRPGMTADLGDASACEDGAIVVHDRRSADLGATWQPLIASGDLAITVERIGCGGGRYWLLARSDAWGYRLVAFAPGQPLRAAGNWEGMTAWAAGGPPITRLADGTFLVAGLAWRDGDPAWSLRESPARVWAGADVVLGRSATTFLTSHDAGASWMARPAPPFAVTAADAFGRGADGAMLVSTFAGTSDASGDAWHAQIWRSTDDAVTWTSVYDASATRGPSAGAVAMGEAHRFVGLASDGAWVATDAISRDGGATWQATQVKNDRSPAFLTPGGRLVATRPTGSAVDDVWRVYADAGAGELLASYQLAIGDAPVAASVIQSVAFDDAGYAYIAGGAPYVQLWRSETPLDR